MHRGKYDIKKDFIVTIELQYANEIDSDPSKSFILFELQNMLENGVKAQWIVLSHVLFNASQISCESMGVKGINLLIKVLDWKNIINMTYSFKYHNY